MAEPPKRRALGRGLDALLPAMPAPRTTQEPATVPGTLPSPAAPAASQPAATPPLGRSGDSFSAPIEQLHPNRFQPRTRFDDVALNELATSLGTIGILEPILVRRRALGGYEIIAGERRWRAAQRAGLHDVPVLVREMSDAQAFEAALVENLVREDLGPVETARAFQHMIEDSEHSIESIAKLTGRDRSTISNSLRLLKLPDAIIDRVENRELTEGHARALLGGSDVDTMLKLANEAVEKAWSVRETERRVRATAAAAPASPGKAAAAKALKSPNVRDLEEQLGRKLGTRVTVADRKGKGHLTLAFTSYDELDRLLEVLLGP
jgi:ParB family chromosome partitioning protein